MPHLQLSQSDLGQLRRHLINASFRFLAWVLPVMAIANLSRWAFVGQQAVVISTAAVAIFVILIYRFRHSFSTEAKCWSALGFGLVVGAESFLKFGEAGRVLVIMTMPVLLISCAARPRFAYAIGALSALYPLLLALALGQLDTFAESIPLVALAAVCFTLLAFLVSDKLFGYLLRAAESEHQARRTDQSTGGLNEVAIREQIVRFLARPDAPVVRVYLLHLRQIVSGNNSYDSARRDQIAVHLNALLTRSLPANVVHGRLGDGNVVVVAPRSDWSETESALRQLKSQSVQVDGVKVSLDPVVVTTDGPIDGTTAEQLLDNLRRVLERALRDRLELARFLPIDKALLNTEYLFVGDLTQAMEGGDLKLFLQPKVKATDVSQIVGAEALIRWNHPSKGLLSPEKFLVQIENSNARVEFAKFVIHQSAQILSEIRQQHPQFQLSFNLSAYDLNDLRIIAELQQVMEFYEFPKNMLQIEISESETAVQIEAMRRSIDAIRNLGYSVSLDDFGTGMCSLNYFRSLAVDTVKIDRAFLESIETSEIAQHVVHSIVELCKGLKREVVVEGVETERQAQLVVELGCDLIQGYLYGKPLVINEFLDLLTGKTKPMESISS